MSLAPENSTIDARLLAMIAISISPFEKKQGARPPVGVALSSGVSAF
jgi:hypothetical protein